MHRLYRVPAESCYVPIQVGASLHPPVIRLQDCQGENISQRNPSFCELTALYWIWKHAQADILGLVHYRRHFARETFSRDS